MSTEVNLIPFKHYCRKCRIVEVNGELPKNEKEDFLLKRHYLEVDDEPLSPLQEQNHLAVANMSIEDISNSINSGDESKEMTATHAARKILTRDEPNPPIDILINSNVVPKLVEFLSRANNPDLQLESARALTNIASGTADQTKAVISAGAVAGFITLLGSPHPVVVEVAVWALGNIAYDGEEQRDYVIEQGIIKPLLALTKRDTSVKNLRNVTKTLFQCCEPAPTIIAVRQLLPALAHLINNNDEEILADVCWALFFFTELSSDEHIQEVVDAGVLPRLVALLDHNEVGIIEPALFTIGNIVTDKPDCIKAVVISGAVPGLSFLMGSQLDLAKEAVRILCNIAIDGQEFGNEVIELGVIKTLLTLVKNDTSAVLLRMITFTLCDFCCNEDSPLAISTVRELLPALAHLIHNNDKEILANACQALSYLTMGPNDRIQAVVDAGVVPRLVALLDHEEVAFINSALLTIGNIVKGSSTQTNFILAAGAYPLLAKLLFHSEMNIVNQAAVIVSNIVASNAVHNVTRPLVDVPSKGDLKCQKEAAWDITNITLGGNADEIALKCQWRHRSAVLFVVHITGDQGTQDCCGRVELLASYFGGSRENGRTEESFLSRKKVLLGLHRSV